MAWTAYVQLDPDKTDVGTARAVWNEGQSDEFTYGPVRAQVSGQSAQQFKADAAAALAAHQARMTANANLSTTLTNIMNQ